MRNVDLSRLRPGPDVWELGIVWHPAWTIEKNQPPYRPTHAWCMSRTRHKQISFGPSRRDEGDEQMVLLVLTKMLRASPAQRDMPSRILVCNEVIQTILEIHTEKSGIAIEYVDSLPLVDEGEERLRSNTFNPYPNGYFSNVEPIILREYANAAVEFGDAEPWLTLHDNDLVEIDPSPEEMRYCVVSGGTGRSKGFHFYRGPEEHNRFAIDPASRHEIANRPRWLFTIDSGLHVPNADLDRWDDFLLPWIWGRAFPLLELLGGEEMPDDDVVAYITVVLRALAEVGRKGIDGPRMHKIVRAYDGPVSLTLSVSELVRS